MFMLQRSLLMVLILTLVAGQSTSKSTGNGTQTSKKSAATTAPSSTSTQPGTSAGHPTAIIHTTAGDLKCELFPDKAPKAAANFIGLASGTKDWTDPGT